MTRDSESANLATENRLSAVRDEARRQLEKERFDEAVRAEVMRLKTRRPWWHTLFPYEITIRRRS